MRVSRSHKGVHWLRFIIIIVIIFVIISALLRTKTTVLKSPFEIEASEQWIVRQDGPGEILARHTLGRRQTIQGMEVFRYERNDFISINLNTNMTEGALVEAGHPILIINSLNDNAKKKILEARQKKLQDYVELLKSGPGQAKVEEAQRELALAKTNFITYLPEYQSTTNLVGKGVLSQLDADMSIAEYAELEQLVNVSYQNVLVKQQEISPLMISMAGYELEETTYELDLINARITSRWLKTPIPGRLTRSSGNPDILLRVVNENKVYARIVIPLDYYDKIHIGDSVQLKFHSKNKYLVKAEVEHITVEPLLLLGQSVAHVLVAIDNRDLEFSVAMTGEALFSTVTINPLRMLGQRIKNAFSRPIKYEQGK